jgi:anthranilate synthase component II
MKILVIDNYDSFTYNLVQYIEEITNSRIDIFRNDKISLNAVSKYDMIVLSPGPGLPKDAGIMPALIKRYAPTKSILGVCLGHQAIGEAFGGTLRNLSNVYHGIATSVHIIDDNEPIFDKMPSKIEVGRYHSWVVNKEDLPSRLKITAIDDAGEIMAMRHLDYHVKGVQFHPESVMTPTGKQMLENFLAEAAQNVRYRAEVG